MLDRYTAQADREASSRDREESSLDPLTGVHQRGAGVVELAREMARAKRTEQPLVGPGTEASALVGVALRILRLIPLLTLPHRHRGANR